MAPGQLKAWPGAGSLGGPPSGQVDWQHWRYILFDDESILAFLVQDERTLRGKAETALWTNSEDSVKAHLEIFEQGCASGLRTSESPV